MMDIKEFNAKLATYWNEQRLCHRPTRVSFLNACRDAGLDPFISDRGHWIASDGETYGEHIIIGPRSKHGRVGNWGSLVESGKIKDIRPLG